MTGSSPSRRRWRFFQKLAERHPTVTPAEMDAACGAAMAAVDRLQRELDTMTLLRDEILVGVMFP